jgi:hypothetical protein
MDEPDDAAVRVAAKKGATGSWEAWIHSDVANPEINDS